MGKTQDTGRLTNGIYQDSSNNIAIGDSTASGYKFKVTGTSNLNGALSGTSAEFSDTLRLTNNLGGILEAYTGSALIPISYKASNHTWFVNGVAQMYYSNNGNLSIGSTSDNGFKLEVTGTAKISGAATFSSSVTAGDSITISMSAGNYPRFISTVGAKSWEIGYRSGTTNYEIREDGNTRMVIANGGNVGIGTSNPTSKLSIVADWVVGGATVRCYPLTSFASGGLAGYGIFDSDGTTRKGYINVSSNYMEVWCQANSPMTFGTNDTERMRISSGGHVGIKIIPSSGWGSSMSALQIGTGGVLSNWTGGNNNFAVGVNYYDNGAGSTLRLYSGGVSKIEYSEDNIIFANASSNSAGTTISFNERMRVTSAGLIGVGLSNPVFKFDTYGTGAFRNEGGTNIFNKQFNRETSNTTHTVATVNNVGGNNSRVFLKLTILSTSAVSNVGNAQTAFAFWAADGTRQVSSVTLDGSFGGNTNVVSLSWSGNNLQMTTTAPYNYENYQVIIQAVQRDGAIIS